MPGFEVFGEEERTAINELFDLNGGILFAHGFDGLRNGVYRVREFEKAFAERMGVAYTQAVSSGTAALKVALDAMEVGRGCEVIIPAFTFVATIEAVIQTGAVPVIVDIDESLNMDPNSLKSVITNRTKAIIPVHMMGAPADMEAIMAIAREHNLYVLEDAAQGCGGTFNGKPLGTIGHMGAFSFDAGKVIITGEGGMIATQSKRLYEKARASHDHGHEYSETVGRGEEGAVSDGFNYRMTEIQGAIGIVQLGKLDMLLHSQRRNKAELKRCLDDGGFPFRYRNILDEGELGDALIFFLEDRKQSERFVEKMKQKGIGTKNVPDAMRWHFARHWDHIYDKYGWYKESFQTQWIKSEKILERAVALPVMVKMTDDRIQEIGEIILRIAGEL